MLNSVNLIGRLAQQPGDLLRYSPTGVAVMSFTLAVKRRPVQNGDTATDWIDCVTFGKNAENIGTYLQKGSQIAVEGRLQTRSYQTQTGKKRQVLEVIVERVHFLGSKKSESSQPQISAEDDIADWDSYRWEVNDYANLQ